MGQEQHETRGALLKWSLLVLVVALGCANPTAPSPDPVTLFAASGTVERTGERAWRVVILPGPDRDQLPSAGCASIDYRLGDLRGRGNCHASVTTDLSEQPYLEVTVFVTRGERVTSGVLGGRVPSQYGDLAQLEVILADQ